MARPRPEGQPAPAVRKKGWLSRLGWTLLAGFLIVWAFVLGIMVGQGSLATSGQVAAVKQWLGSLPGLKETQAPEAATPKDNHAELTFYKGVEKSAGQAKSAGQGVKKSPAAKPAEPRPEAKKEKGYKVQVASFKVEAMAAKLAARLKKAGHPAYVAKGVAKGLGVRYRVRVGPFANSQEAVEAAGLIRLRHKLAAFVVAD